MKPNPLVRLEQQGAVAQIILSRAEVGNAISLQLCHELHAAVEACAKSSTVRAVLLTGEGPAFCVGGDLVEFGQLGQGRPDHLSKLAPVFHAAQQMLMTMRAPVIVAVQGAAAGAGLSLAMTGDIVLAAKSAHFTVAYTAIGLSSDGGSTHLLPRLIGLRRAQELMLTNRRLSAAEALDWGMVTSVVEDAELSQQAQALTARLAAGPTDAYGVIKALLAATYDRNFVDQTDVEGLEIARLSGGAEAEEGIAAFRAKRKPVFQGEPASRG